MYCLKNKLRSKFFTAQIDIEYFKIEDKINELKWVDELNVKEISEQKKFQK